ncbi:MAG TPA: D-cysteine desulfhydrase family protein [Anaerolineae bacterium]|nr:D-cysteine desulfhydrase family protein [Anaerolineae bacterium]
MHRVEQFFLANLPTPLELMSRLSSALGGPELWIKRDDLTGLATGGNKTRKLELLLSDALSQGADVVLTVGAPQSNHCRQTAAAAAKAGLACVLVLRGHAPPLQRWTGNLLLDQILGARLWWAADQDPLDAMRAAADAERAAGRSPYVIPYGGSNPVGASAYALAFDELWNQMMTLRLYFDRVVFASSSGGTQAGLVVGARACCYDGQVLGISVDKTRADLHRAVSDLLVPTAEQLKLDLVFGEDDVQINDNYLGKGYGILSDAEADAIRLVARTEGILLDPVYTGKAMAGLHDLIKCGAIGSDETVLFWHTGGIPALFAHSDGLLGGA